MTITTLSVGAAVTPAVVKTCVSHYANRKPRHQKPTAHISYDEGLHLIRSFLGYAATKTVDDLQSFTANTVPHPPWVRTEGVTIPTDLVTKAADTIIANLGEDGVQQVGGRKWWQWRRNASPLKADWVEMRADYNERKTTNTKSNRVMLYVHGGGYFFGSVEEHRYMMQRHARKLKARVIAPRYRLAPQFPFPCGLQDCLAVYLYLLTVHDASEIVLAGDSAGGGMIVTMLCLVRDQGLPLPAGAVLISPWVDLSHSFPSVAADNPMDYIPPHGFHHKPSTSWPPLNEDEIEALEKVQSREEAFLEKTRSLANKLGDSEAVQGFGEASYVDATPRQHHHLSVEIDGKPIKIKDQTQMYTTNQLLSHPLVSPVMQPSLGGLPPMLVLTGGGELLRDEQIYLAHKAANPQKYPLGPQYRSKYDPDDIILNKYRPTPVQLQVWEDLCHVAPTLSFTRPAKYMFRSIAQFGAWALARAQNRPIEIVDDDNISIISSQSSDSSASESTDSITKQKKQSSIPQPKSVGKAGDPLPVFQNHMIRQRVDRYGNIFDLAPASQLPATTMDPGDVGVVKPGPVRKWMAAKRQYDVRFASTKKKVLKQRLQQLASGAVVGFGEGERPPPSALAGRRTAKDELAPKSKRSYGLAMWSGWGSKHDEATLKREETVVREEDKAEKRAEKREADAKSPPLGDDGERRPLAQTPMINEPTQAKERSKSGSRNRARSGAKMMALNADAQDRSRSRRRTISVTNTGQADASLQDLRDETTLLPTVSTAAGPASPTSPTSNDENLIVTPPATATNSESAAGEHLSPGFMPKFKPASHSRTVSRGIGGAGAGVDPDAASMMTGRSVLSIPDNASTMAVFSAAGVSKETSDENERPTSPSDAQLNGDARSLSDKASTIKAGNETPASRRSLERLKTSNALGTGSSDTASMLTGSMDGAPEAVGQKRLDPVRSPSSTAVVQAEGVVGVVEGGEADQGLQSAANGVGTQRPGMYDRGDSEFKTAKELL